MGKLRDQMVHDMDVRNLAPRTIMAQGKSVTFSAAELGALPANGDTVEVTYTVTPGGSFKASNLNLGKSNVN